MNVQQTVTCANIVSAMYHGAQRLSDFEFAYSVDSSEQTGSPTTYFRFLGTFNPNASILYFESYNPKPQIRIMQPFQMLVCFRFKVTQLHASSISRFTKFRFIVMTKNMTTKQFSGLVLIRRTLTN